MGWLCNDVSVAVILFLAIVSFAGVETVGLLQVQATLRYGSLFPSVLKDASIFAVTAAAVDILALFLVEIFLLSSFCRKKELNQLIKCLLFGICLCTILSTLIAAAVYTRSFALELTRLKKIMQNKLGNNELNWKHLEQDLKCCGVDGTNNTKSCTGRGCFDPFRCLLLFYSSLIITFMTLAAILQIAAVSCSLAYIAREGKKNQTNNEENI